MSDDKRAKAKADEIEASLYGEPVEYQLACIGEIREMLNRLEESIDDYLTRREPDED